MHNWLERNKDLGLLFMRLFIGVRLVYGVQDNIFHWERMKEFEAFLTQFHFPVPLVSAVVSVYAQAIAGILILAGWKIRWAGAVMAFNFLVAIVMVHWGQSFEQMTAPLAMLFGCLLFVFNGAGRFSADTKGRTSTVVFKSENDHDNVQEQRERVRNNNGEVFS